MLQGLSTTQAQKKLSEYGPNEIIEISKVTPLKILLRQVKNNFVFYMLAVSALISFFVGKDFTAYSILLVIVIVVFVGFFQEYKAEESIASLRKMILPTTLTLRDDIKIAIPSNQLVPQDIIYLANGEKIPADCLIIESYELRINESTLTGEAKEIAKIAASENSSNISDVNKLFMGTYIVGGHCIAKVTHTGMSTSFGKIAHLISTAEKELPLQDKVNKLAKYMVYIAIVSSVLTGALMLSRATDLTTAVYVDVLILVIALSVSAFPEGFPVVLATTLALGAKRMSAKNAIVNRMSIIETLGEVTVICSDKTGTITKGEMTVKFLFTGKTLYDVEGSGYSANGRILKNGLPIDVEKNADVKQLILASILCNNATIEKSAANTYASDFKTIGSPTESSLLVLGAKVGFYRESFANSVIQEYPFSSERKMMSVLCEQDGKYTVYAKGAPEIMLKKCEFVFNNGDIKTITQKDKDEILKLQNEMAGTAYRTIMVCSKQLDSKNVSYQEDEFIFLGLIAIEDSPREDISQSIKTALDAGIRVCMVTGDNKETAISIAKQIGLKNTNYIEGSTFDQLSDAELSVQIKSASIFARVRPEHKIRLVKIFKSLGETVAMTGDGVNDAPALKEAHVGIAMGKNGTDVSRSAADMILKDDNFSTIVHAIAEGRNVYNNIRKFVTYQLSCSIAEIAVLLIGVLLAPTLGWQTPILLSLQILFMNLVTDNLPALTLALNPVSGDVMTESPRNRSSLLNPELLKLLLNTGFIMAIATLVAYYVSFNLFGFSNESSRTTAMVTLVLVEIASAFSFRSFRKMALNRSPLVNKQLVAASVASILLTLLIIYTPLSAIFETSLLSLTGWAIAVGFAILVLIFNDGLKYFNLKKPAYLAGTK